MPYGTKTTAFDAAMRADTELDSNRRIAEEVEGL